MSAVVAFSRKQQQSHDDTVAELQAAELVDGVLLLRELYEIDPSAFRNVVGTVNALLEAAREKGGA